MARRPLPPTAAAISFIDCINRGDLDGLGALAVIWLADAVDGKLSLWCASEDTPARRAHEGIPSTV